MQRKYLLCWKKGSGGGGHQEGILPTWLPTVWEAGAFSGPGGMGEEALGGGTRSREP